METFSCVAIVIKGLVIWGWKCHQKNSPVVCDGYVKYEEAEVDRLVAILKTNNCGVEYSKQSASARAAIIIEIIKNIIRRNHKK